MTIFIYLSEIYRKPRCRDTLVEWLEGGRDPALAGFGGGDEVEVVEAAEEIALRGEVLDGACGEGGAGGGLGVAVEGAKQLDPEDGDGLVVAAGGGVLAADGLVEAAEAEAHAIDRGGFAEGVDEAGSGEDVGGVGPLGFGQGAGLEGVEEGVDLGFGGGKGGHGSFRFFVGDQCARFSLPRRTRRQE
jgi:hypothetical protein